MTEEYPTPINTHLPPHQEEEGMPIFGHHISKHTGILILALGALTAIVLIFALQGNSSPSLLKTKTIHSPAISPTPTSFAQSVLSLEHIDEKQSNVIITTGMNKVTLVHLELSFNPKTTTVTDITPGTFFKNPVSLLKGIDLVKGTISYTLAIQPVDSGVNGSGIVAHIFYHTINKATSPSSQSAMSSPSPITILPTTVITAEGIRRNVRKF